MAAEEGQEYFKLELPKAATGVVKYACEQLADRMEAEEASEEDIKTLRQVAQELPE